LSRSALDEVPALPVLGALSGVEGRDWAVVSHDAGPYLAAGTFFFFQLDALEVGHFILLLRFFSFSKHAGWAEQSDAH
jgi:hypothetical protein